MRGKRPIIERASDHPGSIPACAGETIYGRWGSVAVQVHPRLCGGNVRGLAEVVRGDGPSPPVRGKPLPSTHSLLKIRSIPACAGETFGRSIPRPTASVHPRLCGGNHETPDSPESRPGPSPPVRGKRRVLGVHSRDERSIPACAGETRCSDRRWNDTQVHPRLCGGNVTLQPYQVP